MTRLHGVMVTAVMALMLTGAVGTSAFVAPSGATGYPVVVHDGTCGQFVAEPLASVGTAVAPTSDNDKAAEQPGLTLTTSATIDVKFDDLQQQPHAIVVHESADNFATAVACGEIGGAVVDGKLLIGLYPVDGSEIFGIAIVEEGSGVPVIGNDKTRITVYLLNGLTPPAPTVDLATPVAPSGTPVAGAIVPVNPVYTTGPVTIMLTDEGFVPVRILSAVGHDLTVTLTNSGTWPHNFTVDELNIDIDLEPGETDTLHLNGLGLGEFPYYSNLPAD